MSSTENKTLLEVKNLKKHFPVKEGFFSKEKKVLKAVDGLSFSIKEGETFGIVGESGCGKSTLGNMIMNLLEPTEGDILFEGKATSGLTKKELKSRKREIQMVFQDPYSSLNPRMRIKDIIAEPLTTHKVAKGKELEKMVLELMDTVGLSPSYAMRFPHEFSGGQRQRIVIARALALRPKLIVCDEPVSALDVSIQAQILNLLRKLQAEFKLTYVFIAHGLPAVKYISDRIAVMYLGQIVELTTREALFQKQLHPYTKGLLNSVPIPDPMLRGKKEVVEITGDLPSPVNPPSGCRFHTRCPFATEKCQTDIPEFTEYSEGHFVACHYPLDGQQIEKEELTATSY